MKRNERHIVSNPAGGWDKKPGASRSSAHTDTQRTAEQRAKQSLRNDGGGEAITHAKDGRIRASDTIAPARDLFPPRDNEH